MDIGEFCNLFNLADARDKNHALRDHILKPENCFNPLVIKRVNPSTPDEVISIEEITDLNKTYFDFLSGTREAIKSEEIISIIEELSALHERLFRLGQPDDFEDFLNFKGLFLNCQWYVCSSDSVFPQDIICTKENFPSSMKFSSFLKENETLKGRLSDIFKDVLKINTKKISALRYKNNPIWQILTGHLEPEYDAFEHALHCLKDKDFQRQWDGLKKKSLAVQEKLLKKHNRKAKAHIESLDEFDYWRVDYSKPKVIVHFKNKKIVELVSDDFGKTIDQKLPETWKGLLIILGQEKTGSIETYKRQRVNMALRKIFDNDKITFFRKNEPIPFRVEIERSKIDQREEYFREEQPRSFKPPDDFEN
jgi:hypothetical protein